MAVVVGQSGSLVEVAARECFYTFGITKLRQIAAYLGVELPATDCSLFKALVQLIKHVLKCDDEMLVTTLRKRVDNVDPMLELDELWQSDDAIGLLEKEDQEEATPSQTTLHLLPRTLLAVLYCWPATM